MTGLTQPPPTAVGHPAIDAAHERLNGIFDRLDHAVACEDRRSVTRLAEELFRSIETQFADEERLMAHAGYDDTPRKAHIRGHNAFMENLLTFVAVTPGAGCAEVLAPLSHRLRDDFRDHLAGSDAELAHFLTHRGR